MVRLGRIGFGMSYKRVLKFTLGWFWAESKFTVYCITSFIYPYFINLEQAQTLCLENVDQLSSGTTFNTSTESECNLLKLLCQKPGLHGTIQGYPLLVYVVGQLPEYS